MSFTPIRDQFPNHTVTDLNCAICTNSFESEDGVLAHEGTIPHAFHPLCIQEWLFVGSTCPTCNLEVTHVNGEAVEDLRTARIRQQEVEAAARAERMNNLITASEAGNLQQVQELLQIIRHISKGERGLAVYEAATYGHREIVLALLANGTISEDDRGLAVRYAAKNGHQAIVMALLANGTIPEDDRGLAVYYASENGHVEIVRVLLANGLISESDRGRAVRNSAKEHRLVLIQTLLSSGSISDHDRGAAVIDAAENGLPFVIQALFTSGSVNAKQRALAGVLAASGGHISIAMFLLSGSIRPWFVC